MRALAIIFLSFQPFSANASPRPQGPAGTPKPPSRSFGNAIEEAAMTGKSDIRRRWLIGSASAAGLAIALPATARDEAKKGTDDSVTPTEDLMREHGVLQRLLLIYDAGSRRLEQGEDMDPGVFVQSSETIRDFIHDYHEKLEEDHVFPRFKKAGRMVELVDMLATQHAAGRKLTDRILQMAPTALKTSDQRKVMIGLMRATITLYLPHVAREDTDLFPTLRSLMTASEFEALGETFEKAETAKFGSDGFEKTAKLCEQIEKKIGIHDLAQAMPKE
jgi:hemerythrin-like domain-containing protein